MSSAISVNKGLQMLSQQSLQPPPTVHPKEIQVGEKQDINFSHSLPIFITKYPHIVGGRLNPVQKSDLKRMVKKKKKT